MKKMNLFSPPLSHSFCLKVLETQCFQGFEGNWEEEGEEEDFTGINPVVDGSIEKGKDPGRKEEEALSSQSLIFSVVTVQQKL